MPMHRLDCRVRSPAGGLIGVLRAGDMIPLTTWGRLLTSCSLLIGIFFIAMPLACVGGSFFKQFDLMTSEHLRRERERQSTS
jgi:hypothetical protein